MKNINPLYRVFALTMALVIFTTSVNYAIDMHYCQGKLKSVSFFGKAKNCHEMAAPTSCPHHQKMKVESACSISKKDCCSNKTVYLQADYDQLTSSSDFAMNLELQQFVIAFVKVFFQNNFIEKDFKNYTHHTPPFLSRDTYALFQIFLL